MKNMKSCIIYLTRHGETEWNEKKLVQGHTDIPLNKKGVEQAKQLGRELKNIHFEAVFSSDLLRAKDSAKIIVLGKGLSIVLTNALRERFFGRFEGRSLDELRKALGETMVVPKEKQENLKLNDVENDEGIISRLVPFMKRVASTHLGKNVLMVTHGGLLRAFLSYLNFKIPKFSEKPLKNTGYLIIKSDGKEFEIKEERLF